MKNKSNDTTKITELLKNKLRNKKYYVCIESIITLPKKSKKGGELKK